MFVPLPLTLFFRFLSIVCSLLTHVQISRLGHVDLGKLYSPTHRGEQGGYDLEGEMVKAKRDIQASERMSQIVDDDS